MGFVVYQCIRVNEHWQQGSALYDDKVDRLSDLMVELGGL